ncbi:hypothetical protein BS78_03G214300 [Paspalum vaginatum]|nr:hypothetical protein BS78_03G214300 [Paspalum vaginatum]
MVMVMGDKSPSPALASRVLRRSRTRPGAAGGARRLGGRAYDRRPTWIMLSSMSLDLKYSRSTSRSKLLLRSTGCGDLTIPTQRYMTNVPFSQIYYSLCPNL